MKSYKEFVKPSKEELQKKLDKLTYEVTQEKGTEKPFTGEHLENKREGIYVDILSGEPLFCSKHKYNSGSGWPSFYDIINKEYIVQQKDYSLFETRIELTSKYGKNHLGHVFTDGPTPTRLRYCINSVSMKFIPKEDMKQLGYGKYLYLFEK